MGILIKIINWIKMNGAALLGCLQAIIKAVKELLTAVVDLISLFIPVAVAQAIINKIRAVLESVDGVIEIAKVWLLKLN